MSQTLLRLNVVLGAIAAVLLASTAQGASTQRISISNTEIQGNATSSLGGDSIRRVISSNGRYVAFVSTATNLVAGDTNIKSDVFVRDRLTGQTERISVSGAEVQGNQDSSDPSISADGRYVAFASDATNFFADANNATDIFLRDRQLGTTVPISVGVAGAAANGRSSIPHVSASGLLVAFSSDASNLVGADSNGFTDVFVRDWARGTTSRVSLNTSEVQGNASSRFASISADGRYVAFSSRASNLAGVVDNNEAEDIFVRDRTAGTTERVSVRGAAIQANGSSRNPFLSENGRYVTFGSNSTNLVSNDTNDTGDVFVRDRTAATTTRVSLSSLGAEGNGSSGDPSISADGRYVVFRSLARNLVSGDGNGSADIFLRDRETGITSRVSLRHNGAQAAGSSSAPSVNGTGRFVAFKYLSNDLIAGDTNGVSDVYLRDRGP